LSEKETVMPDEQPVSTTEQVAREIALAQVEREYDSRIDTLRHATEANEKRGHELAMTSELTKALSPFQFANPTARAQCESLLRANLRVFDQDTTYAVRTLQWEAAGEYIKGQMQRPEFAHFLAPRSTPSTPTASTPTPPTPAQPTPSTAPPAGQPEPWQRPDENLAGAIIRHHQAREAARQTVDPRWNVREPFGLKARKP
jgi:hypothetical protein